MPNETVEGGTRSRPDKLSAQRKVQWAVKAGTVVKPDACERCGTAGEIHAHHHDYSKPLEVEWLCRPCHGAEHATVPPWVEHAQRLHEKGVPMSQIARSMGKSTSAVWKRLHPERTRELNARTNAKRRAAKRAHEREQMRDTKKRGRCLDCRGLMGVGVFTDGVCGPCRREERERMNRLVERLWADGWSMRQIADEIGTTVNVLGQAMIRMRKKGYELPHRRPPRAA